MISKKFVKKEKVSFLIFLIFVQFIFLLTNSFVSIAVNEQQNIRYNFNQDTLFNYTDNRNLIINNSINVYEQNSNVFVSSKYDFRYDNNTCVYVINSRKNLEQWIDFFSYSEYDVLTVNALNLVDHVKRIRHSTDGVSAYQNGFYHEFDYNFTRFEFNYTFYVFQNTKNQANFQNCYIYDNGNYVMYFEYEELTELLNVYNENDVFQFSIPISMTTYYDLSVIINNNVITIYLDNVEKGNFASTKNHFDNITYVGKYLTYVSGRYLNLYYDNISVRVNDNFVNDGAISLLQYNLTNFYEYVYDNYLQKYYLLDIFHYCSISLSLTSEFGTTYILSNNYFDRNRYFFYEIGANPSIYYYYWNIFVIGNLNINNILFYTNISIGSFVDFASASSTLQLFHCNSNKDDLLFMNNYLYVDNNNHSLILYFTPNIDDNIEFMYFGSLSGVDTNFLNIQDINLRNSILQVYAYKNSIMSASFSLYYNDGVGNYFKNFNQTELGYKIYSYPIGIDFIFKQFYHFFLDDNNNNYLTDFSSVYIVSSILLILVAPATDISVALTTLSIMLIPLLSSFLPSLAITLSLKNKRIFIPLFLLFISLTYVGGLMPTWLYFICIISLGSLLFIQEKQRGTF